MMIYWVVMGFKQLLAFWKISSGYFGLAYSVYIYTAKTGVCNSFLNCKIGCVAGCLGV